VGVYFTATASVGVTQTGDYYATLVVNGSPKVRVPVTMTVIDQPISPTAAFASNAPVCDGAAVAFTNTSDLGTPPADQFLWTFGDGITSTLKDPTHLYGGPGSYTVTMALCNMAGCDTAADVVEVWAGPTAGFTWAAEQLLVTFTNTSQDAATYLWAFGDGITSTLANPVHTYAAAGTYTVTLEAGNDCGTDAYTALVTVTELPVAGFGHNAPVCLGAPVVFTNTSANADTFLWAFGDGITATVANPAHTYAAAGTYTVSLEACRGGDCDTAQDSVAVLPLPAAAFTWAADLLTVTLTNGSQAATSYLWAFGDGGTSTETNPVHTYAAAGTYSVVLTATGVCGEDVVLHDVTVSTAPPLWHIYLPLVVR
jgi:PKD repeat protein